jgi:hypothetical protein
MSTARTLQMLSNESSARVIQLVDIPASDKKRGREAFILSRPFWAQLVQQLEDGLGPHEAIEINLVATKDDQDKKVDLAGLATRVRYQFAKTGMNRKYSLLGPRGELRNQMFIVEHQTAASVLG